MSHHHHHHGHAHKCSDDVGELYSLFNHIDTDKVTCLNEKVSGSAKKIFKPWDKRLDREHARNFCFLSFKSVLFQKRIKFTHESYVESDADEELIIHIPFTGVVKLKNFMIIGGPQGASPSKARLYINREDIDFQNVNDIKPVQEFELAENPHGDLEYTVNVAKFQNLSSITFHFPGNLGGLESTSVYYIGMKGDFIHARREPVIANYELRPNPAKNQTPADQFGAFRPGY